MRSGRKTRHRINRLYDDFLRLLFLHTHREASALDEELTKKTDQFRFLHTTKSFYYFLLFTSTYLRRLSYLSLTCFTLVVPPPLVTPSLVLFPHRSA